MLIAKQANVKRTVKRRPRVEIGAMANLRDENHTTAPSPILYITVVCDQGEDEIKNSFGNFLKKNTPLINHTHK